MKDPKRNIIMREINERQRREKKNEKNETEMTCEK